jgi:hypothetical protein
MHASDIFPKQSDGREVRTVIQAGKGSRTAEHGLGMPIRVNSRAVLSHSQRAPISHRRRPICLPSTLSLPIIHSPPHPPLPPHPPPNRHPDQPPPLTLHSSPFHSPTHPLTHSSTHPYSYSPSLLLSFSPSLLLSYSPISAAHPGPYPPPTTPQNRVDTPTPPIPFSTPRCTGTYRTNSLRDVVDIDTRT